MTKIVTVQEMTRIEMLAYEDGEDEALFMENAGAGIANRLDAEAQKRAWGKEITLLCGKGNNAGDAYVAGATLLEKGYQIQALQIIPIDSCSELSQKQYKRFVKMGGKLITPEEPLRGVLLDGIFGTGFHGEIKEPYASVIDKANASGLPIVAIDTPSGLNGSNGEMATSTIMATLTIYLGLPKLGYFLLDGWNAVGELVAVDFGLSDKHIGMGISDFALMKKETLCSFLPSITRNRHKYEAGYVVGLAGSKGMAGAATLSSYAALCSGAGIVRLLHPEEITAELATTPCEIIKQAYTTNKEESEEEEAVGPHDLMQQAYEKKHQNKLITALNKASGTFIGPGIGCDEEQKVLLQSLLPNLSSPLVLDADALNILARNRIKLPSQVVMTPHIGEMHRLLKLNEKAPLSLDFLKVCARYSKEKNITLVLKGAPTVIFSPDKTPLICPFGTPGMATAGSGDVLCGIIASLLAQGLTPFKAACLGVYLHALAAECATKEKTLFCLTASDIIFSLPSAFKTL